MGDGWPDMMGKQGEEKGGQEQGTRGLGRREGKRSLRLTCNGTESVIADH